MSISTRAIVLSAGKFAEQICVLASLVVLSRVLTREALGTYRQAMMIALFLGSILAINLPTSLYYFVPRFTDNRRQIIIGQTGIMLFFLAAIASAFMFFFARHFSVWMRNPALFPFLRVVCFFPFAHMLSMLIMPVLVSMDKALHASIFTLLYSLVRILSLIVPLLLGKSLIFAGYSLVICTTIAACLGLLMLIFRAKCFSFSWDTALVKEQLYYVYPLIAAVPIAVAAREMDRFIISFFFDTGRYAAYSNGAMELPFMGIITASITAAIMPELVTYGKNRQNNEMLNLWKLAAQKCALVIFPVFFFALVVSSDLITVLFSSKYADSVYPFRVYLFVLPVRIAIYVAILRATANTKFILRAAVLGFAANFIISISLVLAFGDRLIGFIGPAIGTVLTQWGICIYTMFIIRRICGTSWAKMMFWRLLSRTFLIAAVAGAATWIVGIMLSLPPIMELPILFAFYGIIYIPGCLIAKVLSEDEKRLLFGLFRVK